LMGKFQWVQSPENRAIVAPEASNPREFVPNIK
jgi:hypothetical protein